MTIVLLTRSGCAACLTARTTLARICADVNLEFTETDVDDAARSGDKTLRAEYGDRLPVVLLDDVEHSYWEVDEPRLRDDLARRQGRK
ncbi:glutaredoxin family protein [Gordonia sp. TBRC 11910]|uniref:Glutaredoxin family protein n=1 Tax=Gordonia asplenii TaxID=2725283 RepID=A0A848KZR1_9ACTN|nr:glutaredoxin family protein [Gordonia asplenii]NMO03899.1 glutaredoxin family protein [Gordonia asplenii]